jgi:pilus assembly protein Flp/PilA
MLEFAIQWIKDNYKRQEGQAMAEYGVILALIAVAVIVVLATLGGKIKAAFQSVIDAL